jgi:hypothetical protein
MRKVLLAATALGLMANVAMAQEIPVVVLRPGAPPPPADGCGGYGSLAIKWIEEAADAFDKQGATFKSGDQARQAVMEAAKPKLSAAWRSTLKQQMAAGPSRRVYAPSVMLPKRQGAMDPKCFPKLFGLVAHNEQRLSDQHAAELARLEAESQRRAEEAAKREAEAVQRAEAERKAAEAERRAAMAEADARSEANMRAAEELRQEAAKPENQLRQGQAEHDDVLYANVNPEPVTFTQMVVGCRQLEDTLDQPRAYQAAGREIYARPERRTGPCQFFDANKEHTVRRIASSDAWPKNYSAMCIARSRTFGEAPTNECFWIITPKSNIVGQAQPTQPEPIPPK